MKKLYTAKATAAGGRSGNVTTDDGKIDKSLSVPKGLGGDGGDGTNPEQLFGSAYAACYGSALELIAEKEGVDLGDFSVTATVSIGKTEEGDLQLAVILDSYLPGVDVETGENLVNKAHEVCPYSRATRDNIDVTLNLLLEE
ncbi:MULTISPECIES: organic hydroperoxide resistance protein [Mesonia]|uniref:Organic hydroperoxide resistance protein OhrB n=1 Tax=Mesonia oceanica TaxID=2687242 RepID=A0AC61YDC7_9FLAO|nr:MULTISPECIES: organic hydroperoxide resistance protein [Mesonia]MAN28067.1 Ohr subfamily peroxiredoxin [Mesonia sp.]MAQ39763.1 Ohr subfamily peroxiredoxin [Mesonia sp.]MBJ98851.1 Ohr subfamily peroxiredoxin [Flavobacteriaceae bacterium]VVV02522.1 Organic hydroperoxide resistance protein OhrB [Mesonia oceanica]|tara:strand:- start:370 stop:795 length:426 start_codon:yes stop_codon:yes gene_type:complete